MRSLGYLDILGVRYRVVSKRLKNTGECDTEKARLSISDRVKDDATLPILWHETIHAVEQQLSLKLTEEQVDGLASGLSSCPQLSIVPGK